MNDQEFMKDKMILEIQMQENNTKFIKAINIHNMNFQQALISNQPLKDSDITKKALKIQKEYVFLQKNK